MFREPLRAGKGEGEHSRQEREGRRGEENRKGLKRKETETQGSLEAVVVICCCFGLDLQEGFSREICLIFATALQSKQDWHFSFYKGGKAPWQSILLACMKPRVTSLALRKPGMKSSLLYRKFKAS